MIVTLENLSQLDFAKGDGLIPAVVQHAQSGAVLMVAWMNEEALRKTMREGKATFWSRSRGQLWRKGETSGNELSVTEIHADCDRDTLLVRALPAGPVCHTGTTTCFDAPTAGIEFLGELERIVAERVHESPEQSYTARLWQRGVQRMAQKVGEEGLEVALAATAGKPREVLSESADLLYHLIVLLRSQDLALADVAAELQRRHTAKSTPQSSGL